MEVGIGLPATIPGVTGDQLTEWARRSESAGFSSLGTIDRIVYGNLEPFIALAAAAAVTERIGLLTSIAILPYRQNAAFVAKQAASIQALSGGRLTLGLAVGGREDDFEASGVDFKGRGKAFESMLARMKDVWAGEEIGPKVDPAPSLIIGGSIDAAFERAARYGDGWIMGGGPPDQLAQGREKTEAAWKAAGREGSPRIMGLIYYSLGEGAEDHASTYLRDYYAWLGDIADMIASSAATDADTLKQYISGFEQAGCDELVCFPSSPDPDQVDLLAEAAL